MDRYEAETKLKIYHNTYGDLIYTTDPQELLNEAKSLRERAKELDESTEAGLLILLKAVQYETAAACRNALGANWVAPIFRQEDFVETDTVRSLHNVRQARMERDGVVLTEADRKEIISKAEAVFSRGEDDEPEIFGMKALTHDVVKPRFKIGDACWIADFDEDNGEIIGYVPATVVGLECYPDSVHYMIGFYDEFDGTVTTNFETVDDVDIFEEMPDFEATKVKGKDRSHLKVVK